MATITNESGTTISEWHQSRILNKSTCGQIMRFKFPLEQERTVRDLEGLKCFHFEPCVTLGPTFICPYPYWQPSHDFNIYSAEDTLLKQLLLNYKCKFSIFQEANLTNCSSSQVNFSYSLLLELYKTSPIFPIQNFLLEWHSDDSMLKEVYIVLVYFLLQK